jgi:hypothetical protein
MESVELLQWCLKDFPPSIVVTRLKVVHLMFLSCVVGFDNARASGKRSAEFDPEPILDMALAALLAPLRKAEKTASSKAS